MKKIFEEVTIGNIKSKNRLVRSATQEGLAVNDGHIGETLVDVYRNLAKGGVGIIITGMFGVDENSRAFPSMVKTYEATFVDEMKQLVDVVHKHDSKIVVQLAHDGAKASPDKGNQPLGPSTCTINNKSVEALSAEEIKDLVECFVEAALACKQAGADGIQIHGAHGYLLSEFLSPYFNHRTDSYGGSIQNRARIIFEIYDAIRNATGDHFPIWIKINCEDFVEGGLSFEESLWVCQELDKRGIDGIEVSGGISVSAESSPTRVIKDNDKAGTFSAYALAIAKDVKTSVISVGGYRSQGVMEHWLNQGNIDAISLCRPLICEPDLPNIWKNKTNQKSKCISCNRCFDYTDGFNCKVFK